MVEIKPFKGTRPYNEDAKNLIAPSTDHLSIENIEIFKKNNYWNYLKILNPVGQLKEADTLLEAKSHFKEMKENLFYWGPFLDKDIGTKKAIFNSALSLSLIHI